MIDVDELPAQSDSGISEEDFVKSNPKAFDEDLPVEGRTIVTAHHMAMLVEKGFARGSVSNFMFGPVSRVKIYGLTFDGHELLDLIRDKEVWGQTRNILEKVGSFSKDVLTKVAVEITNKIVTSHLL